MLPWIPTRYPLTHFLTKYTYTLHDVDALNEPPVHYLEEKKIPPFSPRLDIDNFMTSSFMTSSWSYSVQRSDVTR